MSNSYCCCFGRFVVAATAAFFSPFPRTIYLFLNAITCGSSAAMANEKGRGVVRRKVGVWRRWRGSFPPNNTRMTLTFRKQQVFRPKYDQHIACLPTYLYTRLTFRLSTSLSFHVPLIDVWDTRIPIARLHNDSDFHVLQFSHFPISPISHEGHLGQQRN